MKRVITLIDKMETLKGEWEVVERETIYDNDFAFHKYTEYTIGKDGKWRNAKGRMKKVAKDE